MLGVPGPEFRIGLAAHDLAEAGYLDVMSSDYVPAALLLAAARLSEQWGNWAKGLATVTSNPARAVGLKDRGEIGIGKRADLIRFTMRGNAPALRSVWSKGARVA